MDLPGLRQFIENVWRKSIIGRLEKYVRIPNKSPAFDPDWERHGYMDQAVELMAEWCRAQSVPGIRVDVHRLRGITPWLLLIFPANCLNACCFMDTWTSSRSLPGGCLGWG